MRISAGMQTYCYKKYAATFYFADNFMNETVYRTVLGNFLLEEFNATKGNCELVYITSIGMQRI